MGYPVFSVTLTLTGVAGSLPTAEGALRVSAVSVAARQPPTRTTTCFQERARRSVPIPKRAPLDGVPGDVTVMVLQDSNRTT